MRDDDTSSLQSIFRLRCRRNANLSMSGKKGNAARRRGINGDLLILDRRSEPHPELIRDENDLLCLLLSVPQASLGRKCFSSDHDGKEGENRTRYTTWVRHFVCGTKDFLQNSYEQATLLVNVSVYIPKRCPHQKRTLTGWIIQSNFQPNRVG